MYTSACIKAASQQGMRILVQDPHGNGYGNGLGVLLIGENLDEEVVKHIPVVMASF